MSERWYYSRPRLAGIATMAALMADANRGLMRPISEYNVRVMAPPTRSYRGKQARRAAFYHRQRCARLLRRVVRTVEWSGADLSDHMRDALVYGMSAIKVERVEPRFTIDPRTKDMGSMFHVRKVSRAEFESRFLRHVGVDFAEGFEQDWRPTEQERKAAELAERYHRETEAYDRTVCTGPIRDGSVKPIGPHELAMVNRNAIKVREQIMLEAAQHGISRQDMAHAINRNA